MIISGISRNKVREYVEPFLELVFEEPVGLNMCTYAGREFTNDFIRTLLAPGLQIKSSSETEPIL